MLVFSDDQEDAFREKLEAHGEAARAMLAALTKLAEEATDYCELHSALEDAVGEAQAAIAQAKAAGITTP